MGVSELLVEQLDGEPVAPHLARALIELLASQSSHATEAPDQHELKNHFVYSLLFEPSLDEEYLIRQGQMLGIDLTIPRAAILIDATEDFSLQADLVFEHRRYADELWLRDSAYV